MLSLFGLVFNLRHIYLFPGEELPDASSVVLISQSVQEDIKGWGGLGQDRSNLQKQVQAQQGCWCLKRPQGALQFLMKMQLSSKVRILLILHMGTSTFKVKYFSVYLYISNKQH